ASWGAAAVALGLGLAVLAPAATATATGSAAAPGRWQPPSNGFSPWGPWNTKLPASVPLAPNSAAVVANIAQDSRDNYGGWAVNTDTYSSPIFTVNRSTPRTAWTF